MFCLHQSENKYYGADKENNGKKVSLYTTKDLFLVLVAAACTHESYSFD